VNPLHPIELDIRRRRRPRHQRDRAAGAGRLGEAVDGVRHGGDDLLLVDDADVQVGHERERAAARGFGAVEHDRPGLGDPERAAGDDAVERVELAHAQRGVLEALDRPREPCGAVRRADGLDARGELVGGGAVDGGLVVGNPLAEQVDVGRRRARAVVVPWHLRHSRRLAERRADAPQNLIARGHATTP